VTSADAVPAGNVEVGLGASGGVSLAGGELVPDFLGGALHGRAGVGLGEHWDLELAAAGLAGRPIGGLQVGWTPRPDAPFAYGITAGVGGSLFEGTYTRQVDQDGDGEPDASVKEDYAYATVAPSLGFRGVWRSRHGYGLPLIVRPSYSVAIDRDGGGVERTAFWLDAATGLLIEPTGNLDIGFGPTFRLWVDPEQGDSLPMYGVNVGISVGGNPRDIGQGW
jgi:hypothetical protein